jgi:hypothetical protein
MTEMHLDELNVPGFIRFSIKAKDTEENNRVHNMFREFCKVEVDDNYTLGLKKLLEYYAEDYKFESLHLMIEELKAEIDELRESKPKKEKELF